MPATRYGRISILDLAGSENVRTTQSHGAGLKEAGSINKSLFCLGKVVAALGIDEATLAAAQQRVLTFLRENS